MAGFRPVHRSGVMVECRTPQLWRWFCTQLTYAATFTKGHDGHVPDGFTVIDEDRWASLLSAAEGREVP